MKFIELRTITIEYHGHLDCKMYLLNTYHQYLGSLSPLINILFISGSQVILKHFSKAL